MLHSIMKITGIGPTAGPQTIDEDRDQELELAGLVSETFAPIGEASDGSELSDEQQTQEGLARLYDFLKAKQDRKRNAENKTLSKLDLALEAYQKVKNGVTDPRGQSLKRKI